MVQVIRTVQSVCMLWRLDMSTIPEEEITHSCCHNSDSNCENSFFWFALIHHTHTVCLHLQTCAHPTWFLLTIILSATVQKSPGAYVSKCGPTSISSDCSLCQMSQNNCYDSQGHWENSSAVGMSVQMSPAVTPGASGPFWKNSPAPLNSDSFIDH